MCGERGKREIAYVSLPRDRSAENNRSESKRKVIASRDIFHRAFYSRGSRGPSAVYSSLKHDVALCIYAIESTGWDKETEMGHLVARGNRTLLKSHDR